MTEDRINQLSTLCQTKDRYLIGEAGLEMKIQDGFLCDSGFAERAVAVGSALGVRIEEQPAPLAEELRELIREVVRLQAIVSDFDVNGSELWSSVAVAASHSWVLPGQPVIVADAVLAAWRERFQGIKAAPVIATESVPVKPFDPVDAILEMFNQRVGTSAG